MAAPVSAVDNTDFYLKIDGVKGEVQIEGVIDYIKIVSFTWSGQHAGTFQTAEGPGGASGRFSSNDFSFIMKTNAASPQLMAACGSGKHYASAILVCRKIVNSKAVEYLRFTLSPVMVSKFQTGYDPNNNMGDTVVVDSVSLNFGKVLSQYKPITNQGTAGPTIEGTIDLQKGIVSGR